MPVPCHFDNIQLDRRCVAAYFHGTLPALLQEVHRAGCDTITLDDLTSRAEVYAEAWRVGDPDKADCYLCCQPVAPGALCRCYDAIMVKRHVNVNDIRVLQKLDPYTIVETYICTDCGSLAGMTAEAAVLSYKKSKRYVPRKWCGACHQHAHKPQRKPRPAQQPSLVQQATETVVSGQA